MLRKFSVVLTSVVVVLLGCVGVAHAENVAVVDGRGDMWKSDGSSDRPVPAPGQDRGDIRRTKINHAQRAILVRTRFTELQRKGRFVYWALRIRTNTGMVRFAEVVAGPGAWRGDASLRRRNGRLVECTVGHDLNYGRNVARLRIPRSCLNDPRWAQATAVSAYVPRGRQFRMFFDNGHNDGFRANGWTERLRRG